MTTEEKSEIIIKWCSFCEDEGRISQEELNVLWECHDLLCGSPVFFTEEEYTKRLKQSIKEYTKNLTKEKAIKFLSGLSMFDEKGQLIKE